jgi:hypothetical protein
MPTIRTIFFPRVTLFLAIFYPLWQNKPRIFTNREKNQCEFVKIRGEIILVLAPA